MTRRKPTEPACRVCGCTEHNACEDGCSWVKVEDGSPPLCSACDGKPGDLAEAVKRALSLQRKYGADNVGLEVAAILRAALKRLRVRLAMDARNPDPAWGGR
jgi:hypothetical protein